MFSTLSRCLELVGLVGVLGLLLKLISQEGVQTQGLGAWTINKDAENIGLNDTKAESKKKKRKGKKKKKKKKRKKEGNESSDTCKQQKTVGLSQASGLGTFCWSKL